MAHKGRARALIEAAFVACAAVAFQGCSKPVGHDAVARSDNANPAHEISNRHVYGVRIQMVDAQRHMPDPFGLFFLIDGERPLEEDDLVSAPIVGTFRSAREARSKEQVLADHSILWAEARYDRGWTVSPLGGPPGDEAAVNVPGTRPMGNPDAGLRGESCIFMLPPPLQERGIALIEGHMPGKAYQLPSDTNRSVSESWDTLERWAGSGKCMYRWFNGRHISTEWNHRFEWKPDSKNIEE